MLILMALLAIGIYGGWYVSATADRAEAQRVPPVPNRLAELAAEAATPRALPTDRVATAEPQSVDVIADDPELDTDAVGGPSLDVAALASRRESTAWTADDPETGTVALAEEPSGLDLGLLLPSDGPATDELGGDIPSAEEASAGRIVLRAHEKTWVRVEDANSQILIQQELDSGEGYLVPNRPGLILSVRDAGALEIFIDGVGIGRLGQPGEALPAVSLDPASLKAKRPS
jgi:hypothetical protein